MSKQEPDNQNSLKKEGVAPVIPHLPVGFEEKIRFAHSALTSPESSFEQYLESAKNNFFRLEAASIGAFNLLPLPPKLGTMTPCGNGDFENSIDTSEWEGGYGSIQSTPGHSVDFASLTSGILQGTYDQGIPTDQSKQAHQTWVPTGSDPIVPSINQTAPGSNGAVRIGNAVNSFGCELLRKTFVVTPANQTTTFWYAVVLQDPNHGANSNPYFWVRVTDALGAIVAGLLFPSLGIVLGAGITGQIISAAIGACILLFIFRLVKRA